MDPRLFTSKPVNKTAALVTSQAGCEREESAHAELQALRLAAKDLFEKLNANKAKTPERKALALKYQEILERVSQLKKSIGVGYRGNKDVSGHFIDICRSELTRYQFDQIMGRAIQAANTKQGGAA